MKSLLLPFTIIAYYQDHFKTGSGLNFSFISKSRNLVIIPETRKHSLLAIFYHKLHLTAFISFIIFFLGNSCNSFSRQQPTIKRRRIESVSRGGCSQHTYTSTKEQRCRRGKYTRGAATLPPCWGYSHLLISPGKQKLLLFVKFEHL